MKTSLKNKPLVTIITVVYNAASLLEKTIQSVLEQTYPNIEYIVIDGNSTDGTINIIKKYEDRINFWLSEKDEGIYDAMNKGIELAKGDWINFMNAGDKFYTNTVIKDVFSSVDFDKGDIIYGDYRYIYSPEFSIIVNPKPIKKLWKYMSLCHQTVFMRTSILKQYKFSLNNIAADHELLYRCYIEKYRFIYSEGIIASFLGGGVSDTNNIKSIKHRWNGVRQLTPSIKIDIYYIYFIVKQFIRYLIRKYTPSVILNIIIQTKNSSKRIY